MRVCSIRACFALACTEPALSQSTFGSIVGTVHDQSGMAVPGTTVTVHNLDENTLRDTIVSDIGLYEVLNLKPGHYGIAAEKAGFAPTKIEGLALDARQTLRVDINLQVSVVQQTVTVNADVARINTENATISDSKDGRLVIGLPLNYRGGTTSPLSALATVPGVQLDSSNRASVGGGLPAQVDYTLDGISTLNVRAGGPNRDMYPSSEMISEFRVTSVNNNAEFAQAGDVTVTTQSGTNQVHGSGFWYHQNRALDATTYGSQSKQAKVFNTFGGSLGGPVYLPKIFDGRNKTFFFADYEGNRRPGSRLLELSVPTASMRSGNLNGVPGSPGIDPNTGAPFSNNTIPDSRINPVAKVLLSKYYPLPNYDSADTNNNLRSLVPVPSSTNGYDVRMDHVLSSRQQLFGRWSWKRIPSISDNGLLPSSTYSLESKNAVISYNVSLGPNRFNEFRFGVSVLDNVQHFPIVGAEAVKDLGLVGLQTANAKDSGGFTGFDFSDGTGFSSLGHPHDGATRSKNYQFSDNFSWTIGRHNTKFGFDIARIAYEDPLHFGGSDDFGYLTFRDGAFTGNAFADLLLGLPAVSSYAVEGPNLDQRVLNYAFFAQDEWHATQRLTIGVGLRWELHPPMTEKSGNITNFNR
jgi:hypothetical protein